ncbi:MAG: siroheme synthase [Devosiaceae bacterium]|nr:siroheme synthase [Devosiaceae bacterium]
MNFYPVFLNLSQKKVLFCGASEIAVAKIRLLMKTPAQIVVFGKNPVAQIRRWHSEKSIELIERDLKPTDIAKNNPGNIALIFATSGDKKEDLRIHEIGKNNAIDVNIVDDLENSDFLTPAIVDRSPVTIAIGTEGTAPVLARKIKGQIEEIVPSYTGILARAAMKFRDIAANLPTLKIRRNFWEKFFKKEGPTAFQKGGEAAIVPALQALFQKHNLTKPSSTSFALIGAGPGAPEHLTLRSRLLISEADLVIHDTNIDEAVIDLARREAKFIDVKNLHSNLFGILDSLALKDKQIVIIVPGSGRPQNFDPDVFATLKAQKIPFEMVPGIEINQGGLQPNHSQPIDQLRCAIGRAANSNNFNSKPTEVKNFGVLESLI